MSIKDQVYRLLQRMVDNLKKKWQHSEERTCRLRNMALESVTEKCDRRTDGQTTDKVIPMCRYASQDYVIHRALSGKKIDIYLNYQLSKRITCISCPKYRPCFFKWTEEMRWCWNPFVAEIKVLKTKFYKETNSADSMLRSIRMSCEP